jgi:hypothetical protein
MTIKSEKKLLELCDLFAAGYNYSTAFKMADISVRTGFMWLRKSAANDPDFLVTYMDEEMQWSQAMGLARKILHMEIRSRLERRSALGHDEKVFFGGMPTFQPDLRCVNWSEADRLAYGFRADGLFEDENGCVVQNVIHHEPPIAAQLRVLEMSFGEEYTPTVNQNIVNSDTTGVSRAPPIDGLKGPVPPRPVRPTLPAPAVEDGDYADLLGPEPDVVKPDDVVEPDVQEQLGTKGPVEPNGSREPSPRIVEPTPAAYASEPNPILARRPLSAADLAILGRTNRKV